MNPYLTDSTTLPSPFIPGLAPIFEDLANHAAPTFGLKREAVVVLGAANLLAIAGGALRLDLPMQTRARTNPHLVFSGAGRFDAIRLQQILMAPVEEWVEDSLDRTKRRFFTRTSIEREIAQCKEGAAKLRDLRKALKEKDVALQKKFTTPKRGRDETESADEVVSDFDKELRAYASRLQLRFHTPELLDAYVADLLLSSRQMVVSAGLGFKDIEAWQTSSIDGHVLEIINESGHARNLLKLHPNNLHRVAMFRKESCAQRGIASCCGRVGYHPRGSTIWIADNADLSALFQEPRLRHCGYPEPFIFFDLEQISRGEGDIAGFFSPWKTMIVTLFQLRLHGRQIRVCFSDSALQRLNSSCDDPPTEDEWFTEKVALPTIAMMAAINALVRMPEMATRARGTVDDEDVDVAMALLTPALADTARLREVARLTPVQEPIPHTLERVLAKLASKGPLSKRQLRRSFHHIDSELLADFLERAVAEGRVTVEGGKYHVVKHRPVEE